MTMKIEVKSVPHRKVPVADILPNPHRDLAANPLCPEKIENLLDSISRTGFWDNIVVREHPTKEGKYQLAYGHNRLAALKSKRIEVDTITIPVAKLTDWEMYCAMVDENETQGSLTPAIAFENVDVGCDLIEAALKKVGPEGTWQQFNTAVGRSVSADTERHENDHGFETVRAKFFAGEGIGRGFLASFLPCGKMRGNTIAEVTQSRYGAVREAHAKKQAEIKRKEAEVAKDKAVAEKLRKEAEKLETEAEKIGKGSISKTVLLMFDTPNRMTLFGSAVRKLGIPKDQHVEAAKHVLKEEAHERNVEKVLTSFWYEKSGAAIRTREDAARKAKIDAMKKKLGTDDISTRAVELARKAKSPVMDLVTVTPYVEFLNSKAKASLKASTEIMVEHLNALLSALEQADSLRTVSAEKLKLLK